MEDEMEIMWKG